MSNLQDDSPDSAHAGAGSSRLPTLSAATAAARCGLSEGVIHLAINAGELPVLEVRSDQGQGREYRISPRDLDRFMHGYRVVAATLSVADAVACSGLPVRTIHRAIQCGDLPVQQVAGRTGWEYRIAPADLDTFVKVHVPGGQTLQLPAPSPSTGGEEQSGSLLPPRGERVGVRESRYDWLWITLIVLAVLALAINVFALALRLIADYWTL